MVSSKFGSRLLAAVKFVEQVKRESSKFIKTLGRPYAKFYWQRGYGMFAGSTNDRDEAERYVRSQEDIIDSAPFKTNTAHRHNTTALTMTNNTFGIDWVLKHPLNLAFGQ